MSSAFQLMSDGAIFVLCFLDVGIEKIPRDEWSIPFSADGTMMIGDFSAESAKGSCISSSS